MTIPSPRVLRRALPASLAAGVVVLAGPGAGSAAAKPHTPCQTAGRTIARDVGPNLRVSREGTTLKACTRRPGQRRHVRTLGPWTSRTIVATGAGSVAWTTARTSEAGPVDSVTSIDVRTGKRWLQTTRAAVAPDAVAPASDDRVLRLLTSGRGTAWVTSRGVVAAAVRAIEDEDPRFYGAGVPGTTPSHVGRRFFLGDAGPTGAAAVAKGLRLDIGGGGDECGGTAEHEVEVPPFGGRPDMTFSYWSEDYTNPDC